MSKLFTLLKNIINKLNSKADLVEGKISESQLPKIATDWESLEGKPFYEEGYIAELPSDVSGLTFVNSQPLEALDGMVFSFVKVDDNYFSTPEEAFGASIKLDYNGEILNFVVDENNIVSLGNGFGVLVAENSFFPLIMNVSSVGTSTFPAADMLNEDLTFDVTKTGLYFLYMEGLGVVKSFGKITIKKLDSKFINIEEVAEKAVEMIDSSLLSAIGSGVLE